MHLSDDEKTWIGAGLIGAVLLLWRTTNVIEHTVSGALDVFERGKRLTHTALSGGIVPDDPFDLVAAAEDVLGRDVDPDLYALARMGRSEGTDGMEYRMHVAYNDLADLQRAYGTGVYSSILALMIHSKQAAADGHFSEQGHGKRYATSHDPYEGDYLLAEKVAADRARGVDLADGAIKFVDRSGFGVQAGTGSYEETAAAWTAQGLTPFNLPGATDDLVLWKRA